MFIEQIVSINPATREEIGKINVTTREEIKQIVSNAKNSFKQWSFFSFEKRGSYLKKLAVELKKNSQDIARLITMEMGRPIKESLSEVMISARFLNYFADNTEYFMVSEPIKDLGNKIARIIYEPIGIVAAIKPWNMSIQTPIWAIAPALMTGSVVILKPSENSLLVAKELEKMTSFCGFPQGVLSFVYGSKDTGRYLLDEDIDMVSFTGSVSAGKEVASIVANRFIKMSLELGGKDAMVVFPDCDLDFAAMAAVYGSTTNCGQFCAAVERVYIHEQIYEPMVEKIVNFTKSIRVGNGLREDVDMGPLVNKQQFDLVLGQINDAIKKGAKVLCGGSAYESGELSKGFFVKPTVMVNVNHSMDIIKYETFGPVICLMSFKDEDEAIALANDSMYGLGASVITQNIELAERVASRLDVGMVWINEPLMSMASCPWIARKQSGIGNELGELGVKEFLKPKLISSQYKENDSKRKWWYPY